MQREIGYKNITKQFLIYNIVAGVATIINISSRYIFNVFFGIEFYISIISAYTLGMLFNYYFNKKLNFKNSQRKKYQEMQTFFIIAIIGLSLTAVLSACYLYIIMQLNITLVLQGSKTVAHVSAVGTVAVYSFLGHRFITFRKGFRNTFKELLSFRFFKSKV